MSEHTADYDALRGLKFRAEVACMGYQSLTDDDVPQDYIGTELDAYKAGAADAASAILSEIQQVIPPRLHACVGCGLELDADDPNDRCDECVLPPAASLTPPDSEQAR